MEMMTIIMQKSHRLHSYTSLKWMPCKGQRFTCKSMEI